MPRKPPTTPQPSPQHYWDDSKGRWRLRRGNKRLDPKAEAERLALLQVEAQARPPRTGRPPSNEFQTMTQSETIARIDSVLTGEVMAKPVDCPPPPVDYAESVARLSGRGLDEVLALIEEGHSNREICKRLGSRPAHLNRWLTSMPEAGTRVRDARKRAAQAWLDRGLAALEEAENLGDLAKAREIAQICRRYAAICDPAFSDRVQVDTTVRAEDPASIDQKLRLLVGQVAAQAAQKPDEE